MSENLKIEFSHLFEKYSNNRDLFDVYWTEIEKAYNSKKRHYHNLIHVQLDTPLLFIILLFINIKS